ncbi:hypothetical protein G6O69_00445 [Pseudenhygromyxa sp. WMMC2535]|uniref:hypothetical protein n=1 Tax=Pseudenhygromyxa sp. WMMC2535 TaxID=2712867 RepID=UPI0015551982|nr:hypothetical protein [Pseudenhygromyxa sp. WMMC2535]NVB36279.1 hypothetical protein [Pseudenhygromyxa sp. WMMC2535]
MTRARPFFGPYIGLLFALGLVGLVGCGDEGASDTGAEVGSDEIDDSGSQEGADEIDGSESAADDGSGSTDDTATGETTTEGDTSGETATGDDASDDGSTDDGSTDDGSTDDGSTDDGSTDDGSTDDGSTDDGSTDDGSTDDGSTDDGSTDDGSTDDGSTDDGSTDDDTTTGEPESFDNCGFPEDGPWVEIEYWQLGSVSSPSYSYSDTPGWGEDEWAYQGMSWPEVWSIGANSMNNDPIGIVAEISGQWQIMIGLAGMVSYDYASVCYEGRSVSVSSSATVDVYNPFNGCGVETQISHSWEVHKVGVDLGDCLIPGNNTQAVRLDPWGGSGRLGLVRLRLTLHGAVY